jgi:hypothetical protein
MLSVFGFSSPSKIFIPLLLFFTVRGVLFANPDFIYETENRIVQYIEWSAQEDTLLYELIIERDDGGAVWTPVLTQTTEETKLKIALNAGKYRYRVDVWDLLGRRRPPAPWANLVILKAVRPILEKIEPDFIELGEGGPWRIKVSGENIAENSEIVLSRPNGTRVKPDQWTVDDDGQSAVFKLLPGTLDAGIYSITVQNPGGMRTSMPNFNVLREGKDGWERDLKFMFSLGYNMLYTLGGELIRGENGNYLNSAYHPIGLLGRLSFLPFRWKGGALGFELSPTWNRMEGENHDDMNGNYLVNMHLLGLSFGLVYQTPVFFHRFDFIARAAGGLAIGYQLEVRIEERATMQQFWGLVPLVEGGLAFQFLFNRVFFLEAGANYVMLFSSNAASYIRPMASIGWNF